MDKINKITGKVVPLERANIDTDAIIPKQFLKSIKRTGFGQFIFDEWRYLDHGEPDMDCSKRPLNMDFSLNKPEYKDATILLTQDNFGCGSSREHAVWGLVEFGFKAIIAPSFADIFYNNCSKNGLLAVSLAADQIEDMFSLIKQRSELVVNISLAEQTVSFSEKVYEFSIDPGIKQRLMQGLDDISLSLKSAKKIQAYEQQRQKIEPWIFSDLKGTANDI